MREYCFYGNDRPGVHPIGGEYSRVEDQYMLYDLLSDIWCRESCAQRYREEWSEKNKTLGQCSITAFLVQDIFGGEVYGVPLDGGGFHCFNKVNDVVFDLTSEQFGDRELTYTEAYPQSREEHFADKEKYDRYLYLRRKLQEKLR